MKKLLALTLAAAMILSLSACGGSSASSKSEASESTDSGTSTSTTETSTEENSGWKVSDETINLSAMAVMSSLQVGITDYNDLQAIQKWSEATNVHVDWEMPNGQNEKEQINLSFASKKMPDIYTHINKTDAMKYGEQGALIDLMPLIEEHAPNIMATLKADPATIPMFTTEDGKLYNIPQVDADYRLSTFKTIIIQQAWLDKLNLQTPTTPDETYEVLKAFKENAAQLTEEKLIPYTSYMGDMEGWFDTFGWGFGLYSSKGYVKDGKIVYGVLEPEFKDTAAYVSKLYAEGLIDADLSANKDDATFEAKMTTNRVGMAYVGQGRVGTYNQKVGDTYDAFNFVPMIPVKNADGKVGFGAVGPQAKDNVGLSISINNKNPIETIKAWDWFYSEEGKIAMNLGVEGDTFNYIDGEAQYTDKIMKDANLNANQTLMSVISPLYDFPCARIYDFERAQLGPVLAQYKTELLEMGAMDGVTCYSMGRLPLTSAQLKQYANVEADIKTYIEESLTKFITGEWTVESNYDSFVSTLKSMDIDGLLEVLNDGYSKVMNQ